MFLSLVSLCGLLLVHTTALPAEQLLGDLPEHKSVDASEAGGLSWGTVKELIGGDHGRPFSDQGIVKAGGGAGRRIHTISLLGCGPNEHVSAMSIDFRAEKDYSITPKIVASAAHGSYGGSFKPVSLTLNPHEFIEKVGLKTWKKSQFIGYRTRIGWISFTTNQGHNIVCGTSNDQDPYFVIPKQPKGDAALLYFSGQQGDALDELDAHFVPLSEYFVSK